MCRFVSVPARTNSDIHSACKSFPDAADPSFCSYFCGCLFRVRPERRKCNKIPAAVPFWSWSAALLCCV